MATIPSLEDNARKILAIFINHNLRSGECLHINVLDAIWNKKGLRADDFKAGMEYAVGQGWIETRENNMYCLTEKGFSEA
ncbi:MAG: hypothetical protein MUP16_03900 [Sedimentisphaerales bacterium]|nr:hypothetical protein [Sedimentisphaerales bacterium]